MKTVKIGMSEYLQAKALAKNRGLFLQFVLNEAVRSYLKKEGQDGRRKRKPR
jgi:hypothetical protein